MRPELELAYEAWKAGDYGRLVSHCFGAMGINGAKMVPGRDGPLFKAILRGFAQFIRVHTANQELVIEAVVARLPLGQYVPALRMLLELSDGDATPTRYSVRGDLVMVRSVSRLSAMSPDALCTAIESVATAANLGARALIGGLQAREIAGHEHAALAIDELPRGVALASQSGESSGTSSPRKKEGGMFGAFEPLVTASDEAAAQPAAAPNQRPAAPPPARAKVPTPARIGRPTPGAITVGGPTAMMAAKHRTPRPAQMQAPQQPPQTAAVPPTAPARIAPPPPPQPSPQTRPTNLQPPPRASVAPGGAIGRTMVSADGVPTTEPSAADGIAMAPPPAATPAPAQRADPLGDTFISDGQPAGAAPQRTGAPGDGLCELLHKAQTLGAVLSFADQPATMCLLIRATVYRAIHEHEAAVPDAVALLFHVTAPMTREIYITAPGVRRGSMAIPATSPAFEVMARIVAQRGEVERGEPVAVQPITTAQEAKQHLARYVSEIDQAPSDAELRHFLALGALSELLARTKLPAATQDRLKGILAHAKKEGAKQPVVDLMMTALTRMIA